MELFFGCGRLSGAFADGFSDADDLLGLADEIGNHPKYHDQKEGDGGDYVTEKRGKLVASQHFVVAAKPQDHSDEHTCQRRAVKQRLQRIPSAEQIKQGRCT